MSYRRALNAATLAVGLLAQGCQPTSPPNSKTSQQALYPLAQLGEGYNFFNDTPATEQCYAPQNPTEDYPNEYTLRSFIAHEPSDLVIKFAQHNLIDASSQQYQERLNQVFEQTAGSATLPKNVLVIPILAHTLVRKAGNDFEQTGSCDPANFAPQDNKDTRQLFVEKCGLHFLNEERYGEYIFLSINLNELTIDQRQKITMRLNAEAKTAESSATTALDKLYQDLNPNAVSFHVSTSLPLPDASLLVNDKLPIDHWPDYTNQLFTQISQGSDPDRFGRLIRQNFLPYSAPRVLTCTGDNDLAKPFECYQRHERELRQTMNDSSIDDLVTQAQWLIDSTNQDQIEWNQSSEDPHAKYAEFINRVEVCRQVLIPDRQQSCQNAFYTLNLKQLGGLCENECKFADNCSAEELTHIFNQGTGYTLIEPTAPPAHNYTINIQEHWSSSSQGPSDIDNATERLCLLTGVGGHFAGGGEKVRVHKNNNNAWQLTVHGGQEVYGQEHCVDKNAFFGANNDQSWLPEQQHDISSSSSQSNSTLNTTDGQWVTALMGLTGAMEGGGEAGWVTQAVPGKSNKLDTQSFQGYLRAYSMGFGLENFASSARWATDTENYFTFPLTTKAPTQPVASQYGVNEQVLVPAAAGFCYLTKLQGNFDGVNDLVKLEIREGNWILSVRGTCFEGASENAFFAGGGLPCGSTGAIQDVRAIATCVKYDQSQ